MIIIVEGPDRGGKSTLAQQLARQTGWPVEHRSKTENEEEKARMMGEYVQIARSNRNVILDRCWYSEMVYGKVMRGQAYIDYPQMYALERLLASHGAIIIYCTGPKAPLWKRCTSRGEDYITSRDNFNAICDAYNELMSCPHYVPVVEYEYKEV